MREMEGCSPSWMYGNSTVAYGKMVKDSQGVQTLFTLHSGVSCVRWLCEVGPTLHWLYSRLPEQTP
jgi:hypothetical protein